MPIPALTGTPAIAPTRIGHDTFTGVNGTQLAAHAPEVGGGWFGRGAYAGTLAANKYKPGCCSGDVKFARMLVGQSDLIHVRARITRENPNPGGSGELQGIIVRANVGTAGNSDTNQNSLFFYFSMNDNATVLLHWGQRTSGAGGILLAYAQLPGTFAWARGADRIMDVWIRGSTLHFGLDGVEVGNTGVLATPWNDVDHVYAGIIAADFANGRWDDFEVLRGALSGASSIDVYGQNSGALSGSVQAGDYFYMPGEPGAPQHVITGAYTVAANRIDGMQFTPALAAGFEAESEVAILRKPVTFELTDLNTVLRRVGRALVYWGDTPSSLVQLGDTEGDLLVELNSELAVLATPELSGPAPRQATYTGEGPELTLPVWLADPTTRQVIESAMRITRRMPARLYCVAIVPEEAHLVAGPARGVLTHAIGGPWLLNGVALSASQVAALDGAIWLWRVTLTSWRRRFAGGAGESSRLVEVLKLRLVTHPDRPEGQQLYTTGDPAAAGIDLEF